MIIANAKGQTLKLNGEAVVSDSVEYLKIQFATDSEWTDYVKTAVFRDATGTAYSVVFTEGNPLYLGADCCYVPHEVIKAPEFTVSLFGVKGACVITTPEISVFVIQSGYAQGTAPRTPTPNEYEQILSVATDARTIAQSVRDDAENGAFQGEKGDKGDKGDIGFSGVYVGSGDMPDGYNVQIDPDGTTVDMNTLATKQYVDGKIANLDLEVDLTDYPTKSELADELAPLKQEVAAMGVDYIVEQGTAGIWSYRKWASGIAECWGNQTISLTVTEAWGGLYTSSSVINVTFPFEFTSIPNITAQLSCYRNAGLIGVAGDGNSLSTTSSGDYRVFRASESAIASNYTFNWYVIGRWK